MNRFASQNWLPHAILWLGIAIVAFPIYLAFVASTLTNPEIAQAPMSLLPGAHLVENYRDALLRGGQQRLSAPVMSMMWNSLVMALVITSARSRCRSSAPTRWCSSAFQAACSSSGASSSR